MQNALEKTEQTGTMMGLVPQNMAQAMDVATVLSTSEMIPKSYHGKPADIVCAILMGSDVGLNPMQALRSIAVINGRPSLWGDAILAIIRTKPDFEYCIEDFDDKTNTAICKIKRKGEPERIEKFSEEDAKTAGLWKKAGPWTQYPKRMLKMRARSFAVRDLFAHHLGGISFAEEVQDIPSERELNPPPEGETRTAQVAAILAQQDPGAPVAPPPVASSGVTLADVLAKIAAATDLEKLEAVAEIAATLPEEDKAQAKKIYGQKARELSKK